MEIDPVIRKAATQDVHVPMGETALANAVVADKIFESS